MAIFVAPGFTEVFVLPNRLDDAVHVGSHFTLGQLLRAPSQDQEAFALTLSANEWALWHATPTDRAAQLTIDESHDKSLDDANNIDPENDGKPRGGMHGDRGASGDERKKMLFELYAKRVADATRQELMLLDPDDHVPLFVFAAEPMLSLFIDRVRNGRRVVGVPGAPDRLGAAEIDAALRLQLATPQHRRSRRSHSATSPRAPRDWSNATSPRSPARPPTARSRCSGSTSRPR